MRALDSRNIGRGSHRCWRRAHCRVDRLDGGAAAEFGYRSFSARDQLRRRCTDVITSTCVLVIGVPRITLGLAPMTELRKAILTGGLPFGVLFRFRNLVFVMPQSRN
jgi:hypothetical protein